MAKYIQMEMLLAKLRNSFQPILTEADIKMFPYFEINVEELKAMTKSKWIPVSERLPEMHTKVLCCGIRGGRFIAELTTWGNGNRYWDKRNGRGCPEVTHWMPLPEPPKEE